MMTNPAEVKIKGLPANGSFVGFVDKEPDHVLTLTAFFNYLSIQVESTADTTLLIRGPGGSW